METDDAGMLDVLFSRMVSNTDSSQTPSSVPSAPPLSIQAWTTNMGILGNQMRTGMGEGGMAVVCREACGTMFYTRGITPWYGGTGVGMDAALYG